MNRQYILTIDMGTTAFKGAVFDGTGWECGSAVSEYSIDSPEPGWAEMDAEAYVRIFREVCQKAMKNAGIRPEELLTLGLSVQGETSVFLDEQGMPVRPAIVWLDSRSAEEAADIVREFGPENIQARTGQVGEDSIWPGAKLLWLKRHEPENFGRIRMVLQLGGYLAYRLTGRFVGEDSTLGSSIYWDIRTRKYWPEMLEFIGITPRQLPEICLPGENIGTVSAEGAACFGLAEGTTVNIGAIDLACGAIGSGNIRPGAFSESIGSALCTMTMVDHVVLDPAMQMPCYCSAVPGMYMVHAYAVGGMFMKWFRDSFGETELAAEKAGGPNAYDQLDLLAAETEPGAEGIIALPHLQGSGPPDLGAVSGACFYGITMAHEKRHFVRAIMESVAMVLCRVIEATEALDVPVKDIVSIGGGAMSRIWCQIRADATGRKVITTANNENACCLGAAVLAGVAAGVWESLDEACAATVRIQEVFAPDPENHRIYEKLLERYKRLMDALKDV